jgi:transposase
MLRLPPSVQILACTTPVDLRKSFNGLAAVTESVLDSNPMSGHIFVFFNRRADQIRLLWWDRDGWLLVAKRLERGRFPMPWQRAPTQGQVWALQPGELTLLLEGIDLRGAKRLPRWQPTGTTDYVTTM